MGRVYHQNIHIPQQIVRNIEDLMHTKGELSSCEAISYTARFDNGVEMVIDLNGADDDYPSAVAILFRDDWAIRRTDERREYFGEWSIEYNGDTYVAQIGACEA